MNSGQKTNPHYHTFCHSCCHPVSACCCHSPKCRREPKELVVVPTAKADAANVAPIHKMASTILNNMGKVNALREKDAASVSVGTDSAFIGGGCCVHLSCEYMPESGMAADIGAVIVGVTDSENTSMLWAKIVEPKSEYEIKENIIATHPGAKLIVYTLNVIARVRWCEVFSC